MRDRPRARGGEHPLLSLIKKRIEATRAERGMDAHIHTQKVNKEKVSVGGKGTELA